MVENQQGSAAPSLPLSSGADFAGDVIGERATSPGPGSPRKRFDLVYGRKLNGVLERSPSDSCAGLIDLVSGETLQRAKDSAAHPPLDDAALLLLARGIWRREVSTLSERASLRELISTRGGINGVTLPLPDADLFVSRLPAGPLALILLVRHREKNSAMGDTMPRARLIQVKVAEQSAAAGPHAADLDHAQRDHSHSIWQTLLQALATAFGGATAAERVAKEGSNLLARAIHDDGLVVFAELVDLSQDRILQQHRGRDPKLSMPDGGRSMLALRRFFDGTAPDIAGLASACGFPAMEYGKALLNLGDQDFFWLRVPAFPALHIPFAPDCVLLLYKKSRPNPSLDWIALDNAGLDLLRMRIGSALVGGFKTTMFPFPETHIEFQQILDELGRLPHEDLMSRLDVGGFAAHPVTIDNGVQRCQECIYYLPHRKWCDLPELPVPVEPNWWCRLWKI